MIPRESEFVVPADQWQDFLNWLDEPAEELPTADLLAKSKDRGELKWQI